MCDSRITRSYHETFSRTAEEKATFETQEPGKYIQNEEVTGNEPDIKSRQRRVKYKNGIQ